MLKNLIKIENPIILDIGANVGQTIIKYQKLFPKAEIHSFEPIPEVFENLKKGLKILKIYISIILPLVQKIQIKYFI